MENRNPFFGKRAEAYERFFKTAYGKTVFELEKRLLLNVLNREATLLEVGCGTGMWMETLKKEGFNEPVGVDISPDMLKVAQRRGINRLILGNAENLPFKANSVDTSLFVTSLEFMRSKRKAFVEAVRVSKKSVVVAFLNRYSLLSLYRFFRSLFKNSVYRATTFLTISEIKKLVAYSNETIKDKLVTVDKTCSTLNLTVDGFTSRRLEEAVGFNSPWGGFTVVKFHIKERNGTG